jgi:hypothetical protein
MAPLKTEPVPAATLPKRTPPLALAVQPAGARSNELAGRLPAGVRIIDGEQLYSAAWLGGGHQ